MPSVLKNTSKQDVIISGGHYLTTLLECYVKYSDVSTIVKKRVLDLVEPLEAYV
mgnify:CR=1 FL=1